MGTKKLHEVLGVKCFNKLVTEFGGKRIWIPKSGNPGFRDSRYISSRNAMITALFRSGKNIGELSRRFGLSEKSIYGIIDGAKQCRGTTSVRGKHEAEDL